jgi:cytoskeletal protein CcmA (bactofilin family)
MLGLSKSERAAPPRAKSGSFSVIGADALITGNVVTSDNLQVNGRIEGDVRCGILHQGPSGVIVGNIFAEEVHLSGLADGTVGAALVVLETSARVTGDVTYETLSIRGGARIEGRVGHCDAKGESRVQPQPLATLAELFPYGEAAQAAE